MAHGAAAANDLTIKPRKHRAATACTHCRTRKVRCDVVLRQPCTNCHLDGRICRTLKRRRAKNDTASSQDELLPPAEDSWAEGSDSRPTQPGSATRSTCWTTEITYKAYDFVACDDLSKMSQEDVQFLSVKSCLVLPTRMYLDEFVHNYFRYVHPCLPVLNERTFWTQYRAGEGVTKSPVSLFVMQALLWVSCAFVSPQMVKEAGYDGIKEARSLFYQRAKLLYDLNAERCHMSRSIGSLLLTYRFDPDDRQAASIWLSNAIHHSRAIQAHCFDRERATNFPRAALKRLWWCLYLRDRILPMGLHRPMQLHPSVVDPDMECLSEDDFQDEISFSPVYHPDTKVRLCRILVQQCRLAAIMGEIICLVQDQHRLVLSGNSCPKLVVADWHGKITSIRQRLVSWCRLAKTSIGDLSDMEQSRSTTLMFANITFMYYNASQICLANHELSLLELGISNPGYTYDENLSLISHELREANLGMEHIAMTFVTKGVVEQLPVTTLAYLAFPLLLKILGKACSASTPPQPPQDDHALDPMYCAEVVHRCDSRYDGVKDLVTLITKTLSTIPAEDVRKVARDTSLSPPSGGHAPDGSDGYGMPKSASQGHQRRPAAWEYLMRTSPRLYLRLVVSLNHALSCGEVPGQGELPSSRQEPGSDSSIPVSSVDLEPCQSQDQDDFLFDAVCPSAPPAHTRAIFSPWPIGDLDDLGTPRCGSDPEGGGCEVDDGVCKSLFSKTSPSGVCAEMRLSDVMGDSAHDRDRLSSLDEAWWANSQDWARDLFTDMVDVLS